MGGFVVKTLCLWLEASIQEVLVEFVEGTEEFRLGFGFHGFYEDSIAIVFIKYH